MELTSAPELRVTEYEKGTEWASVSPNGVRRSRGMPHLAIMILV